MYSILVINIGSTSTKVAMFQDESPLFVQTTDHSREDLSPFPTFCEQYDFRKKTIEDILKQRRVHLENIDLIVSRGGGTKPISTGVYRINRLMCDDLLSGQYEKHPSNLGPVITYNLGKMLKVPAIIVDSPSSDEFEPVARFSGLPEIKRRSGFHVLSQKAAARKAAKDLGKNYEHINLIVGHLGGGISVGAHKQGRIIDATHGIEEGPFTPERTGSLPVIELIALCYSNQYTQEQLHRKLVGEGGLAAYLGTSNARLVEKEIAAGNEDYLQVFHAMSYQICKEIGAMAAVLDGDVEAVILTGGLAHSRMLIDWIQKKVGFIAPVMVFPGEDEMNALASGGLRFLYGKEEGNEYG